MKRLGLALMVVAVVWLGGRALVRALASDETKIRARIEAAREGFDDARMDPIFELLSREFQDETTGFQRDDVRGALAAVFFQEKDPRTKGFPFRALIDEPAIEVVIDPNDPTRAHVKFVATIVDTRDSAQRTAWRADLAGDFEKRDDGWRLAKSTHETIEGRMRLR